MRILLVIGIALYVLAIYAEMPILLRIGLAELGSAGLIAGSLSYLIRMKDGKQDRDNGFGS